ncbi:unnamed protein product [Phaeothamnion confervicola]
MPRVCGRRSSVAVEMLRSILSGQVVLTFSLILSLLLLPPTSSATRSAIRAATAPTATAKEAAVADPDATRHIGLSVATWNLAEGSPSTADMRFLEELCESSDVLVVGAQEVETLKPRRHEGSRSREWRRLLNVGLGQQWVRLGHHAMGAVQLHVFARRNIARRCKLVKLSEVACGVGNVLQNKGAIGAFLRVDKSTFLLITAHLAAHQGKVAERNADYWRIVGELDQQVPAAWVKHAQRRRRHAATAVAAAATAAADAAAKAAATGELACNADDGGDEGTGDVAAVAAAVAAAAPAAAAAAAAAAASNAAVFGADRHFEAINHVFFFGDLNYRIDASREDAEAALRASADSCPGGYGGYSGGGGGCGGGGLERLRDLDQLTRERSRGAAFTGFCEGPLTFPPTFKYDRGSPALDRSVKQRVPAWTDRILFRPGPPAVELLRYKSLPEARHSDHRPVVAQFRVTLAD